VLMVDLLLTWGGLDRVHYHEALDVATVHERRGRTVVLHDVVGAAIPRLDALMAGADADRVVVLFPPDRLGPGFHPEAWDGERARAHGDAEHATLMARGPFVTSGPFMLQPLSRT